MPRTEYVDIKLWEVRRTENAVLFQSNSAQLSDRATKVWLPLSEIRSITKEPPTAGFLTACVVTIPDWLAEAREL